jgi:crotonobetainyl-CoA:carnitine CoA-transferase CaiB-like acyl-CoA transferase
MTAIGKGELIEDPRFRSNQKRVENAEELDSIIEEWTRQRTSQRVIDVMESQDAIVGPVYDISDIEDDEQYAARNNIIEIEDPDLGTLKTSNTVPKMSRTPGTVEHAGAQHGEHNEEVYGERLDLEQEELNELRKREVI